MRTKNLAYEWHMIIWLIEIYNRKKQYPIKIIERL